MSKEFSIGAKFKGIDAISGVASKITSKLNSIVAVGSKINSKFQSVNKTVKTAANNVKGASIGAVLGLTAILAPAIAFSAQINELEAVSRSTEKQLASLTNQSKELGATTKFSATQAAEAQTFLARAGFKTNEILAATPATLDLASAANMELARTADIASNIMGGFKIPATQMSDVADVLAAATSSANVNLEELGQAMKIAAPVARKANVSFRETAAVIGLLGNIGIKGTLGGNAFKSIISRLIAPSGKAGKLITGLGVDIEDLNGKIKTTPRLLVDVAKSLKGFPEAKQFRLMKEIFGLEPLASVTNLIDSAGNKELSNYIDNLQNVTGRSKEMAKTMNKGALGAINNLKSATEGLSIQISSGGLLGDFTKIVNKLTKFTRSLTAADQSTLTAITTVLLLTAALAPVLISISALITIMGSLASVAAVVGIALNSSVIKPLFTTGIAVLANIAKMLGLQAVYIATAAQAVIFGTAIKVSVISSLRLATVALVGFIAKSAAFGVLATAATAVGAAIKAALLPPLAKTAATMILIAAVNPLTPIILGIGVLIGLGVLLVKNWATIKTFFKDLGESIIGFFQPVLNIFSAVSDIAGKFSDAFKDEEIIIKAKVEPVSLPTLGLTQEKFDQQISGKTNTNQNPSQVINKSILETVTTAKQVIEPSPFKVINNSIIEKITNEKTLTEPSPLQVLNERISEKITTEKTLTEPSPIQVLNERISEKITTEKTIEKDFNKKQIIQPIPNNVTNIRIINESAASEINNKQNSATNASAVNAPSLFASNQAAVAQQNGTANAKATIEFLNANENILARDESGNEIDLNSGLTAAMGF